MLFVASAVGFVVAPVAADPAPAKVVLSFDFSDNSNPPAASNGVFHITADVLPEGTRGFVRMIAIPPADAGVSNLYCRFQPVTQDRARCGFHFTAPGTWSIRAQYGMNPATPVVVTAGTSMRVGL